MLFSILGNRWIMGASMVAATISAYCLYAQTERLIRHDVIEAKSGPRAGWSTNATCQVVDENKKLHSWTSKIVGDAELPIKVCQDWFKRNQYRYHSARISFGTAVHGIETPLDGHIVAVSEDIMRGQYTPEALRSNLDEWRFQAKCTENATNGLVLSLTTLYCNIQYEVRDRAVYFKPNP